MASSARNQVGLPRSSLGCRGGGADRGRGTALGAGRGAPGAGAAAGEEFAAEPVRLMMARASVARCPCHCFAFQFFSLCSPRDELLPAAARPVGRACGPALWCGFENPFCLPCKKIWRRARELLRHSHTAVSSVLCSLIT